ncbi:MAG: STAS domain-containing protein [Bacteroidia bacterium]
MKDKSDTRPNSGPALQGLISRSPKLSTEPEKHGWNNVKSIYPAGETWEIIDDLPGVYTHGIQYYDLKNIGFISNAGMASLIELLKSLLQKGIEVQFVNVNERIKGKIKALGLDHILNCI